MPQYFFNVHIENNAIMDPEGHDLRDADQAWELARAMARSLMDSTFDKPMNWVASHISVVDELDEIVLELPFIEARGVEEKPH